MKVIWVVLRTNSKMRSWAMATACFDTPSKRAISKAWAAKARTTRMPPRFSSMTLDNSDSLSCRRIQLARSLRRAIEARMPTIGTKLRATSPRVVSMPMRM